MTARLLALGLTLISVALPQQQPQPRAPQEQPAEPVETKKLGALEGRVTNGRTGEPIRRVNLILRPLNAPGVMGAVMAGGAGPVGPTAPYAASTDAEGKFRIEKIDPGSYRMMAERQGFIRQEYGARSSMMGATIRIVAGQELKSLDMKLTPQAVVTGRVLDEEGEPLARVQIQVMRRRFVGGRQQLAPNGGGQTSDTGEFRISDLPPGKYWVNASYRRQMMFNEAPPRNTADKPEEEYVTTYYPDAVDQAAARPIELEAGQELPGIDIRIQKARVYRIRGKVEGVAPAGFRNLRLVAMPRISGGGINFFGGPGAAVKEDGSFEIGSVQPGSYYVMALPMQGAQTGLGRVAVTVARENVEDVTLALGKGGAVTGSIRIDADGPAPALGATRIVLSPTEGGISFNPPATPKDDGTFVFENLGPDRYRVNVISPPPGTWLKSVRSGDQEVLDSGIEIATGSANALQIRLGLGTGKISGVALDAKQQPASGSTVTLLPDPMKEGRNDLYRLATTDQTGQFTLDGVPPGDYELYAWADIEPGAHMDPDFMKPHESEAQKITVQPNSQQQVSLKQIPPVI